MGSKARSAGPFVRRVFSEEERAEREPLRAAFRDLLRGYRAERDTFHRSVTNRDGAYDEETDRRAVAKMDRRIARAEKALKSFEPIGSRDLAKLSPKVRAFVEHNIRFPVYSLEWLTSKKRPIRTKEDQDDATWLRFSFKAGGRHDLNREQLAELRRHGIKERTV